jgi:subfamily B ATP-binding cassette protein HlyB/CyaB
VGDIYMGLQSVEEENLAFSSSSYLYEFFTQTLCNQTADLVSLSSQLLFEFSKAFELLPFQPGALVSNFSDPAAPSHQASESRQSLYIVCQGRVRILVFSPQQQRQVSSQVIEEQAFFGGDSFFCDPYFSYQAVAAGTSQNIIVAHLPLSKLHIWLKQAPQLQDLWREAAQQRQCLIFLKAFTELNKFSSRYLQAVLPNLQTQKVAAGEYLAQATPSEAGRFWLVQGQVQPSLVEVGSGWGYPEAVPPDWVAQTPLLLYHLPKEHLPSSFLTPEAANNSNGHSPHPSPLPLVPPASQNKQQPLRETPSPPSLGQDTAKIEFPKPKRYRRGFGRSYPFMAQQSSSDCGAACLVMTSRYWQKDFSINTVRNLANIGRSGASLNALAKAADTLGYVAKPVRASLNALVKAAQNNPWIAHWQGDHYVVVYQVQKNQVLIADPAQGKRTLSRQQFLRDWTGYALLLEPTERLQQMPNEKRSLGKFLKLIIPYRSVAFQVILASLLIQVFGIVTPLFTQIILDEVVVNRSLTMLHVFAAGILLFGTGSVILSGVRQYLVSYLSNILDLTMIGGFIRHTLMLPLKFFESRHVGDIITRVSENQKIQRFLISKVVLAWLDILMSVVYLGLMLYYNWRLTLLIVALIPPILLLTLAATPWLRRISREVFNRSAEQNSALVETMTGVATVKATASEQELRWRWEDRLTQFLNARFRSQKLAINLQAASSLINSIGTTALLWYGAKLVIQDQLTIGQFVAFNMLIGKVLNPILSLANLWDELQEVLISVERLDDVFSTQPEETPEQEMLVLPEVRGEVRFEHVTFRYEADSNRNTLENITFEVKAGETTAIVGRSGSGKTTLVKLLQGLYQPNQGCISVDGHDLRHVSPQSLRSQLGVVPQECFLFSGTILENITLYRPHYTLEQVIEAAKLAEAHGFIQGMPLGYNTKVGEHGANLSGGQRQRIAIARALIGQPRILLLDEATSSLDTESEQRFQENLSRLSRDRTAFIIAHRLSTVRSADCILVLDQGLIVEKGTHEELMQAQKLYYHLAQQQLDL